MQYFAFQNSFCLLQRFCSALIIVQLILGSLSLEQFVPRVFAEDAKTDTALLTISSDITTETLKDFPLLLRSENLPTDIFEKAQRDGGDIRFTSDAEGENVLPLEIVSFSKEETQLWVRVPEIAADRDTKLYVWHGGDGKQMQPDGSTALVWERFEAVVHGEDDPAEKIAKDSTDNGYDFSIGTVDHVLGIVGKGYSVGTDGNSYHLSNGAIPPFISLHPTVSFWLKQHDVHQLTRLFSNRRDNQNIEYSMQSNYGIDRKEHFQFRNGYGGKSFSEPYAFSELQDVWRYITVSFEGKNRIYLYIDGELLSTVYDRYLYRNMNITGLRLLSGNQTIDELRVSRGRRSLAWIKAEFLNQSDAGLVIVSDMLQSSNNTKQPVKEPAANEPTSSFTPLVQEHVRIEGDVLVGEGTVDRWYRQLTSKQTMQGDGSLSSKITHPTQLAIVGLTNAESAVSGKYHPDYGIYTHESRTILIWINNTVAKRTGVSYNVGDVLKIERKDGKLLFFKNEQVLHEIVDPGIKLRGHVNLRNNGTRVGLPKIEALEGWDSETKEEQPVASQAAESNGDASQHVTRAPITISSDITTETLKDFPLLLRSENLPTDIFEKAQRDGGDIRFTSDAEGENVLPLEIVSFSKEETQLWVRVPEIAADRDTKLYVWYGADWKQAINPTDVWNAFDAVVHGENNPTSGAKDIVQDSSGNGHHFTPAHHSSGKTWEAYNHTDAKIGKGYAVQGSNGYRYLLNNSLPSIASSHPTVSFWWKQGNIDAENRFASLFYTMGDQGLDFSATNYYMYRANQFMFRNGRSSRLFPNHKSYAEMKNVWRHIAVIYKGGNQAQLYIDGELFSTSDRSYSSFTSQGLRLLTGQRWPTASIDEVRFRSGGSSAAWIKAEFLNQSDAGLVTAGDATTETITTNTNIVDPKEKKQQKSDKPSPPTNVQLLPVDDNTIALWRMNGANVESEEKQANDQGQQSRSLDGGSALQSTQGLFEDPNGVYLFNGTKSLQINNLNGSTYGKNTTVEAWVYLDANNVRHHIYYDWDWLPHKFIVLSIEADGTLSALRGKHGNHAVHVQGSTVLQPETWYYVAATFAEGQKGKLYVNGTLDGESTEILDKANLESSTYNGAQIGGYNYHGSKGASLRGRIDEIRVSNKERSDKEIATIYKEALENGKKVSENSGPPAWIQVQEYKEEPGIFLTTKGQTLYYFGVPDDLLTKVYSKYDTGIKYGESYTIRSTHKDALSNMRIEFRTPGNYGRAVASASFSAEYTKRKGSINTWDFKSAHGHGFIPLSDRITDKALFGALVLPEERESNPALLRGIQFIHAIQNTENGTKNAVTPTFRAEIKEGELKLFSTNLPTGFVAALRDETEVIAISNSADAHGVFTLPYNSDLHSPNVVLLDDVTGQQIGPALRITKGYVPYVEPKRIHLTQLAYNPEIYVNLLNAYDQEHFKSLKTDQRQLVDGSVDLFLARQNSASFTVPWTTGSVFVDTSTLPSGVTASITNEKLTITTETPTVPNFTLSLTIQTGTTERTREVLVRLITADVSMADLNTAVTASKEAETEKERRLAGAQAAAFADLLQRTSSIPMQRGRLYIEDMNRESGTLDLRLRSTEDKSIIKLGSNTTTVNHNNGTDFHRLTLDGLPTDETTVTLYAPDSTTVLDTITIDTAGDIFYNQTPWDRIEPGLSVASVHNGAVLVVLSSPDNTSTITGGVHARTFAHANGTAFSAGIVLLDQRKGDTHTLQLQSRGKTYDSVTLLKQSDGTFAVEPDDAWQQEIIKTNPLDRLSPPTTLEESLTQDLQDAGTLKRMQERVSELVTAITLPTAEVNSAIGPHYDTTSIANAVTSYIGRELFSPTTMGDETLTERFYQEYRMYCPVDRCPNGENIETATEREYQKAVLQNGNKEEGVYKNQIRDSLIAKGKKAYSGDSGYRDRYWKAYYDWEERNIGEAQHRLSLLLQTRNHNTTDGYYQGNFQLSSPPYRTQYSEKEKIQRTYQLWENPRIVNFIMTNIENADADQRAGQQTAWKEYYDHKTQCDSWRDSEPEKYETQCLRPKVIDRSDEDNSARIQARNDEAFAARQGESYTVSRTQETAYRNNFRQSVTRNGRIEIAFETAVDTNAELAKRDLSDRGEDESTERQSYVPVLANSNVRDSERQRAVRTSARFAEHIATQLGEDTSVSVGFVADVPEDAVQKEEDGKIVVYVDIKELAETTDELAKIEEEHLDQKLTDQQAVKQLVELLEDSELSRKVLEEIQNAGTVSERTLEELLALVREGNTDSKIARQLHEKVLAIANNPFGKPTVKSADNGSEFIFVQTKENEWLFSEKIVRPQQTASLLRPLFVANESFFAYDFFSSSQQTPQEYNALMSNNKQILGATVARKAVDQGDSGGGDGGGGGNPAYSRKEKLLLGDLFIEAFTGQEALSIINELDNNIFVNSYIKIGSEVAQPISKSISYVPEAFASNHVLEFKDYISLNNSPNKNTSQAIQGNVVGESLSVEVSVDIEKSGTYTLMLSGFNNWITEQSSVFFEGNHASNIRNVISYTEDYADTAYALSVSLDAGENTFFIQGLSPGYQIENNGSIRLINEHNQIVNRANILLTANSEKHDSLQKISLEEIELSLAQEIYQYLQYVYNHDPEWFTHTGRKSVMALIDLQNVVASASTDQQIQTSAFEVAILIQELTALAEDTTMNESDREIKMGNLSVEIQQAIRELGTAIDNNPIVRDQIPEHVRSWHFEERISKNINLPQTKQEADQSAEWIKLDANKSLFHFNNSSHALENKYVHADGREVVYDGESGEIVTDPDQMGSYNYVPVLSNDNLQQAVGHTLLDILPYFILGGNVRP